MIFICVNIIPFMLRVSENVHNLGNINFVSFIKNDNSRLNVNIETHNATARREDYRNGEILTGCEGGGLCDPSTLAIWLGVFRHRTIWSASIDWY